MILNKLEQDWLRKNEIMITKILSKRLEDLKEQILDCPEEKRSQIINFIKEYRLGLQILKELDKPETNPDFTGI
jgi:hypothetical protein